VKAGLEVIARDVDSNPAGVSPVSPAKMAVTCENTENMKA
jgi:hypothetical protein